jgi:alpha-tubulin suppressor-like RCC1 family protein
LTGAAEPAPGNSIDWIEGFSGPILDVDVGGNHACALLATGSVECWGSNGIEFLLGTSGGSSAHPVRADLPAGAAVRLWVDYNRAAALLSDGSLWTWGMNPWGELAHAGAAPAPAEGLGGTPVDVGGGQSHMCARFADEHTTVRCWGLEQAIYGGNSFAQLAPTTIAGLTAADAGVDLSQALAVGDSFTCALEGAGAVACWGSNSQGQLGTPPADLASSATPVAVSGLPSRAEALIAGQVFACALLDNRQLWCWGQHVGNGGYAPTGPEKILEDVITATAEGFAAFARVSNGTWYSWGNGSSLVLGRIYGETLRPGRCCEW